MATLDFYDISSQERFIYAINKRLVKTVYESKQDWLGEYGKIISICTLFLEKCSSGNKSIDVKQLAICIVETLIRIRKYSDTYMYKENSFFTLADFDQDQFKRIFRCFLLIDPQYFIENFPNYKKEFPFFIDDIFRYRLGGGDKTGNGILCKQKVLTDDRENPDRLFKVGYIKQVCGSPSFSTETLAYTCKYLSETVLNGYLYDYIRTTKKFPHWFAFDYLTKGKNILAMFVEEIGDEFVEKYQGDTHEPGEYIKEIQEEFLQSSEALKFQMFCIKKKYPKKYAELRAVTSRGSALKFWKDVDATDFSDEFELGYALGHRLSIEQAISIMNICIEECMKSYLTDTFYVDNK